MVDGEWWMVNGGRWRVEGGQEVWGGKSQGSGVKGGGRGGRLGHLAESGREDESGVAGLKGDHLAVCSRLVSACVEGWRR